MCSSRSFVVSSHARPSYAARLALLVAAVFCGAATLSRAEVPPATPVDVVSEALRQERLASVERVMQHLNAGEQDTTIVEAVYAADAQFVDPIFPEGIRGHAALLRYHASLNAMIDSFVVDVKEVLTSGDSIMVFWSADATLSIELGLGEALRRAGLSGLGSRLGLRPLRMGPVHYDGMTRFEFAPDSALISRHTDYYDSMAEYATIPVLRQLLGFIREQTRRILSGSDAREEPGARPRSEP